MQADILLQVGVKALIKNPEGKYLILRRSAEKYPNVKGRWDIVGGRIDPGSTLWTNLKREIREETNLDIADQDPKILAAQDILRAPGKHVVRLTYEIVYQGDQKIELDTTENDKHLWVSIDELKEMTDVDTYLNEVIQSVF